MARLRKSALFEIVEDAIRESAWNFLHLSSATSNPARYQVYRDKTNHRVRVYIWNLTHGGGKKRPKDEYRIQITGIPGPSGAEHFQPEINGKTLILGWWDDVRVFAGFDYTHHTKPLGKSPSMQIGEEALRSAYENGFSPYNRGNGELAIAFRPDFMGTYVDNLEAIHASGKSKREFELLDEIAKGPESVEDSEIEKKVPKGRQFAIVSTKRALREIDFRDRVLTAYAHKCAFCGVQLKLLDAAHILPVAHSASTDETKNGVALCTLHHRAYDRALVMFDDSFTVHLNEDMAADLKSEGHDGGLLEFRKNLRPLILLPPDKKDRPATAFIAPANKMRGWPA